MAIVRFRKLPKGFRYPLSRRHVKDFVARFDDCIIDVDFAGLRAKTPKWMERCFPHYFLRHPIFLHAERDAEGLWHFTVDIYGESERHIPNDRDALSEHLISESEAWIKSKLDLPQLASEGERTSVISFKCSKEDQELLLP